MNPKHASSFPVRMAGILATTLLIAACGGGETPATPAEPPAPTATAPAAPAAPVVPVDAPNALHLAAADGKLQAKPGVGKLVDGQLTTAGAAGYLMFGPYTPLAAGTYTVTIEGALVDPGTTAPVHFDATANKGKQVFGSLDVAAAVPGPGAIAQFDIVLPQAVADFEVRAKVPAGANVSISSVDVKAK